MTLLDRIVAEKRRLARTLEARAAALRAAAEAAPPARPFADALAAGRTVSLIAEVKRRSPSAGWIRPEASAVDIAVQYEAAGAAAISVLTDEEHFGGTLEDLERVRSAVGVPVLRKDFLVAPVQVWEARAAGADAVLLIVRVLDDAELTDLLAAARECGSGALVEVHSPAELERAVRAGADVVGVNARDLATLETDLAVTLALAGQAPVGCVLVAESGIRSRADVERLASAGVDAVLVGESLMRAPDPGLAARALVGVPRMTPTAPEAKICGVCRPADAAAAARAGADYVGVVLSPGFARSQTVESAAAILDAAAPARRVGVFVDASDAEVVAAAERLRLDVVQLHGSEPPDRVAAVAAAGPWQVWKAVRPRSPDELGAAARAYSGVVDALLVDAWDPIRPGGTGVALAWDELASARARLPRGLRLVLAGGLTPDNVATAIRRMAPAVVDVSSGVEQRPGEKSEDKVRAFIEAARAAGPVRAARPIAAAEAQTAG
ncbi:MAG: indole-3-glycerol phosphate synthase TrpC [bacterium]|jgi:indole-3-glycerol phosphate synthase/phosphoribosylanthranilate isomerase|nr:MAG: indole-3-glycerol phosphate synthase TrpC [bacterium]